MCKFCESLEFSKEVNRAVLSKYDMCYSAVYLDYVIDEEGNTRMKNTHYMSNKPGSGIGFPLNFCPECGKKLVEY